MFANYFSTIFANVTNEIFSFSETQNGKTLNSCYYHNTHTGTGGHL